MNELKRDDEWQRGVVERLLTPVLRAHAFQGQVFFFGCDSQITRLLQMRAHVDAIVPLRKGGDISLEVKLRRWPRLKTGEPRRFGWPDFFLETQSCSLLGLSRQGWIVTCQAEFLLYCFCTMGEKSLLCYPLFLQRLRQWFHANQKNLEERRVPNPINGRNLWTIGKLAPIAKVCRDLKVDGFRVDEGGLVSDLFGKPLLDFLTEGPKEVRSEYDEMWKIPYQYPERL